MSVPLAVGGSRLHWTDLPSHVQAVIESAAGAQVRVAINQPGGFSPGLASVLRLTDSRSVFVKAVNLARNPETPAMHRREAEVLAALPATAPVPRLLWSYDDGDWVALMTEAVDGTPPAHPWQAHELDRFLDAAARLAVELTPSPIDAPTIQERYAEAFTGWRCLAGAPATADRLDPWARQSVTRLAEVEETWPAAASGTTLLHADLRVDNVLLTADGAVVVDWPHACIGADWTDLLGALPSVAMQGGGDPEEVWQRHPVARTADPDAVTAVLIAFTGFFLWHSLQPPPPNLPRLRAFQRAQGEAALAWLRHRL